ALHRGIRRALELGIARQGSTLSTYALPTGERGSMQEALKVYGGDGEPCAGCGTPIEKLRVAGRGTWYCPACQPSPYAATSSSSSSRRPLRSSAARSRAARHARARVAHLC